MRGMQSKLEHVATVTMSGYRIEVLNINPPNKTTAQARLLLAFGADYCDFQACSPLGFLVLLDDYVHTVETVRKSTKRGVGTALFEASVILNGDRPVRADGMTDDGRGFVEKMCARGLAVPG